MHNEIFSNLLHVGMCFASKRNTKLKQSFNSREGGGGGGGTAIYGLYRYVPL